MEDSDFAQYLATQGLRVEERPERGRCLIATRAFAPGELISTQSPYVNVLDEQNRGGRCDSCFKAKEGGLRRCALCKVVMYCGQTCQRSAWPIHQYECKALSALRKQHGNVPTPTLRLAFRLMVKRVLQEKGLLLLTALDNYSRAETLVSHLEDTPQDTVLLYAQMATLVKAMGDATEGKVGIDPKEVTQLFGRFACNAHTICDEELKPVGMGLFVVNSLANHDCNPNAVILYDGEEALMRAVRKIEAGSEITHAYTDLAGSRNDRRERLLKYYFECNCRRCREYRNDPVESKVAGLRCPDPKCEGSPGWDWDSGRQKRNETGQYECTCGRSLPADEVDARQEEVKRILLEAHTLEATGKLLEARRLLEKAQMFQASILHGLNWELVQTSDALVRVCMSLEDWAAAASWCECTLPAYNACLPQPSALYGLQLFTLAKLKWYLGDVSGCLEAVQKACSILSVTHGGKHRLVEEARELLGQAHAECNLSRHIQ